MGATAAAAPQAPRLSHGTNLFATARSLDGFACEDGRTDTESNKSKSHPTTSESEAPPPPAPPAPPAPPVDPSALLDEPPAPPDAPPAFTPMPRQPRFSPDAADADTTLQSDAKTKTMKKIAHQAKSFFSLTGASDFEIIEQAASILRINTIGHSLYEIAKLVSVKMWAEKKRVRNVRNPFDTPSVVIDAIGKGGVGQSAPAPF